MFEVSQASPAFPTQEIGIGMKMNVTHWVHVM